MSDITKEQILAALAKFADDKKFVGQCYAALKGSKGGAAKEKVAKKKKKKVCKTDVTFRLTPDDDNDWKKVEAAVKEIEIDGLMWGGCPLVPFVAGLEVMMVSAQIEDIMVPSTEPVVAELQKIPGVDQAEMVNMETAQNDWGGKSSGKAPKGKGKKKKAKEELKVTAADIKASVDNILRCSKETDCFLAGATECDRSGKCEVTLDQAKEITAGVKAARPDVSYVIVTTGTTTNVIAFTVGKPFQGKGDAKAALEALDPKPQTIEGDANEAFGVFECDCSTYFPLKVKDSYHSDIFQYIQKKGMCVEDSDDDVIYSDDE